MRIIRLILYTVLIAVIASNLVAQNYGRRIGINASYLFAQTSISLKKIDGTQSCCPLYTSGTGNGVAISALGEMQISGSFILGLRAVGSSFSNTMVTPEEMPVFNPSTNQPVRGVFEHRLEASFATLGIEPVFSLRLFDFLSLNQSIGISTVLNRSFRQYEQITEPGNFGTFIINGVDTKKRVNNDTRGDIPNANSLRMTVAAGLSTEFALGAAKNIWIAPEVWYEYALTDVVPSVADESWRISMIRAGLSLKYGTPFINDFDAIIRRKIIIDTITIKQDGITAPVVRTGVPRIGADTLFNADDGDAVITQYVRRIDTLFVPAPTVLPTATLVIRSSDSQEPLTELKAEESIATTSYIPLLRYIFFDEASAAIPARYAKLRSDATDDFRLSSDEVRNTLLCYRHLLNIIGGRMRKNDTSTLTLTGYAPDGTTTTNTESSTKLALERAASVRAYLETVWGIDTSRIRLRSRTLPDIASNTTTSDGMAENRRVEFSTDDTTLLAPVIISDTTLAFSTTGMTATLQTSPESSGNVWQLRVLQDGRTLYTSASARTDSAIQLNFALLNGLKERGGSIDAVADLTTASGYIIRSSSRIGITRTARAEGATQLPQRNRNKLNLILFYVRSAQLGSDDAALVAQLKKTLKSGTRIAVTGHTDRTGDMNTNRALATERARSTAAALGTTDATISAEPNSSLYDNSTPEGRFYCRTVEVVLDTK